jgi:hypothetical protein
MRTIPAVMTLKEMEELRIYLALKEAEEEAAATDVRYTLDEVLSGVRDTLQQHRLESAGTDHV